jgi:LmbE family N-acetylglucosaminyl deacetylase
MLGCAVVAKRRVFVAPHYDDIALSCGGQVAIDAHDGTPLIVTVFAGEPRGAISDFARFQHERWGVVAAEVIAQRRREDECAAAALGASVASRWLDFLDAIYRDVRYGTDSALVGDVLPEDLPTADAVREALQGLEVDEFLVPLGIGNHVDHQLVYRAGQMLSAQGAEVWAYADVPYVIDDAKAAARLARGGFGERRVTYLDDDAFERKCRAVECYTSQLPVIFRDFGDVRSALEHYARAVGGGKLAEVCWRVPASSGR